MKRRSRWIGLAVGAGAGVALAGTFLGAAALAAGTSAWRRQTRYRLAGKVILVTGGSRGLGFAIARECLRQRGRVAICARGREDLERAVRKLESYGEVFSIVADLTDPGAAAMVARAVRQKWGEVEVLIHAAGVMQVGPWDLATAEEYRQAMELHCWAALRLVREVLPGMIARREGRITMISSIGGLVPVPHMLPYTVSKFALTGLAQGLATEVRRHGVRVTCVCPFLIRTGSQENVEVRGQTGREFAWFAAAGSVPGWAQSTTAAARDVVSACRRGVPLAPLWLARPVALAHALAPSSSTAALGWAARWLPETPAGEVPPGRSGRESYNAWTARYIRPLVRREGRRWNQPAGQA